MTIQRLFNTTEQFVHRAFSTFHNVPFKPVQDAPDDHSALLAWASSHVIGRDPLPVYNGASQNTIYSDAYSNYVFRAWHDCLHITHVKNFSRDGELFIAEKHAEELHLIGAPASVIRVMWCDTAGQFLYHEKHNEHVSNQRRFVEACLQHGLDTIIDSGIKF